MKELRVGLIIITMFLTVVGLSSVALAFHDGGVAYCDGCHTMHGSVTSSGSVVTPSTQTYLLIHTDPSSACLNCHASASPGSYHIMTPSGSLSTGVPPVQYNPGGDFGWLLKNYSYSNGHGGTVTENGQTHGHNIIAADYSLASPDSDYTQSPGGNFPSSQLACTSCHDPHGKYRRIGGDTTYTIGTTGAPIIGSGSYDNSAVPPSDNSQAVGSYRLLAGNGYTQNKGTLSPGFTGVPIAVAPHTYNVTEVTNQVRVAYGAPTPDGTKTTWGDWCGACHRAMYTGAGGHVHPVDVALGSGGEDVIYRAYVSSGKMTGLPENSYLSLVPFMENTSDINALKGHAAIVAPQSIGPGTSDQVSCLTCHRAHASAFPFDMRWDMSTEFLTNGTPDWQIAAEGRVTTINEGNASYYGRLASTFGPFQRSLCNKCHAKD